MQDYRYSAEHQIVEATVTRYRERPALQSVPAAGKVQTEPAVTVQATRYCYDALGRRIDETDAFGKTSFLYNGDLLAGEIRELLKTPIPANRCPYKSTSYAAKTCEFGGFERFP